MNAPLFKTSLFVTLSALAVSTWPVVGQEASDPEGVPERSAEVQRALGLVEQYIAAEQSSVVDRVESRSEMLEFKFRATRENGRYRLLGEDAWRAWEKDRSEDREIRRLQVMGTPQVEKMGKDLVRVHCAVHLNMVENGESWEGVSLRSFEVSLDEEGGPRIRHEQLLANREGIQPGRWKKYKKADTESGRSNLRSSPTSKRDNVVGKVENGETLQVWDQKEERWLVARTESGLVGFIHRSQIDFTAEVEPASVPGEEGALEPARPKSYPFAVPLPGKPGYVLNPFTNTMVDVRGLKAGTLVRDPRDPVPDRPFRVPFQGRPVRALIVEEDE